MVSLLFPRGNHVHFFLTVLLHRHGGLFEFLVQSRRPLSSPSRLISSPLSNIRRVRHRENSYFPTVLCEFPARSRLSSSSSSPRIGTQPLFGERNCVWKRERDSDIRIKRKRGLREGERYGKSCEREIVCGALLCVCFI